MRYRTLILSFVLALLLSLLLVFVYFYFSLIKAPKPVPEVVPKVKGITHIRSIYGYGKKPDKLLKGPVGVATDKKGRIFVSDTQNYRVLIFDKEGKYLGRLGEFGREKGQIARPEGIDTGPNGDVYVSDPDRNALIVFGSDLNFKGEIVDEIRPLAVYDGGEKIYLITFGHLSIYDKDLNLIDRWGKRGREIGQFDFPHGIVVLKDGTIVVSDGNNMRLVALKSVDKATWVVGKPPGGLTTEARAFGLPAGMAVDKDENLYVADPLRHAIHIYNKKGEKLAEYGEMGSEEGQFYFPSDIAYLGGNSFVVSDTMNHRVQIIKITLPR